MEALDFGYLVEGIVELDPLTGRLVLSSRDLQGRVIVFDPQVALEKYKGQEVRFTLASFETLGKMQRMVEEGEVTLEGLRIGSPPV